MPVAVGPAASPALVVLGGLPGVGKSTVAGELAAMRRLAYVRIDTIEHALVESGELGSGGLTRSGYLVGYGLARDLLRSGNDVLVECVNPYGITRSAWRASGVAVGARVLEVELVCGDRNEHRRRVSTRSVDIPNFALPTWADVEAREYEPWVGADLRLDTSMLTGREAAEAIAQFLADDPNN